MLVHRARAALVSLSLVAALCTAASAQVIQFVGPAATSAPFGGLGNVPAALDLDVLNVVPEDALGLVTAHHLRDTQKAIETVLRKLEVPVDGSEDYAKFNTFLDGLTGWDEKRTHAMAFFYEEGEDPKVAVFVPVTSYREFATRLGAKGEGDGPVEFETEDGPDGWMASKGKYAVLVESDEKELLQHVLTSTKSLASANEPLRKWISDHPLAGVVTTAGVQKAVDAALEGLEEAQNNVPDEPIAKILVRTVFPTLETLLKTTRDEMTHLAAAPSLDDTKGFRFSARAVFKNDGKYAAAVREAPTLPADALAHLPDDGFFTAQAQVYPQKMSDEMMQLGLKVMESIIAEGNAEVDLSTWKPLLEQARELGKNLKYASVMQSLGGASMYDGMGGIYKVDDSAAFMKTSEAMWKQSLDNIKKLKDDLPEIPVEKKQVSGVDCTVMTIDVVEIMQTFDENAFKDEQQKMVFNAMFGADGKMRIFVGPVDATHIVYALSEETFSKIADNIRNGKQGLADDVMIKKTAALLPTGAASVAYIDLGGYIAMVKNMMIQMAAAQPAGNNPGLNPAMFAQMIPPFPEAPPIGYTVKFTTTTLEGDVVVPMDLMEATRDYVKQTMAMFGVGR